MSKRGAANTKAVPQEFSDEASILDALQMHDHCGAHGSEGLSQQDQEEEARSGESALNGESKGGAARPNGSERPSQPVRSEAGAGKFGEQLQSSGNYE